MQVNYFSLGAHFLFIKKIKSYLRRFKKKLNCLSILNKFLIS